MSLTEQIIDLPLILNYLNEWNDKEHKVILYDVPTRRADEIKKQVTKITNKFKYIIQSPKSEYSNISILDIDL